MTAKPRYPIETFRKVAVEEGIVTAAEAELIEYMDCPHCDNLTIAVMPELMPRAFTLLRLLRTLQLGSVN